MPDETDKPLKIGDAAAKTGMSEATLRFYEKEGLVSPARTARGTRLYEPAHMRRLAAILALTRAGVGLDEIRLLTKAREGCVTGDESSARVSRILAMRLSAISRRRRELERLENELRFALELVEGCRGCHNRPDSKWCPDCPVNRSLGKHDILDLFWE